MPGTAAAASSRSTVMRTISEPARWQRGDLRDRLVDIGGVGVGHRLDDDRRAAADHHAADMTPTECLRGKGEEKYPVIYRRLS